MSEPADSPTRAQMTEREAGDPNVTTEALLALSYEIDWWLWPEQGRIARALLANPALPLLLLEDPHAAREAAARARIALARNRLPRLGPDPLKPSGHRWEPASGQWSAAASSAWWAEWADRLDAEVRRMQSTIPTSVRD